MGVWKTVLLKMSRKYWGVHDQGSRYDDIDDIDYIWVGIVKDDIIVYKTTHYNIHIRC